MVNLHKFESSPKFDSSVSATNQPLHRSNKQFSNHPRYHDQRLREEEVTNPYDLFESSFSSRTSLEFSFNIHGSMADPLWIPSGNSNMGSWQKLVSSLDGCHSDWLAVLIRRDSIFLIFLNLNNTVIWCSLADCAGKGFARIQAASSWWYTVALRTCTLNMRTGRCPLPPKTYQQNPSHNPFKFKISYDLSTPTSMHECTYKDMHTEAIKIFLSKLNWKTIYYIYIYIISHSPVAPRIHKTATIFCHK